MSVTEKCKRLISGALSLILALGMCSGVSVQGHGPVAGTFSGSNAEKTVRFSAHFEKTDAAQVKFDHVAAQGVCAVEPRSIPSWGNLPIIRPMIRSVLIIP